LDLEQQEICVCCQAPEQHRRRHQKEFIFLLRSMAATPSSKQVRARWMHHRRDVLLLLYLMTAALSWHSRWAAALESRGANQLQQSHRQFTSASASGAAFAFPTIECLISRDRRNRYFCAPSALFPGKRGGGPVKEVGQAAPRPRNARLGINVIRGRSSIASYCQRRGGEGGEGGGGGGGGGAAAAAAEEGNIALVTGANRGLGRGLVQELASSGYTVIACCRDKKNGDELAAQVQAPGSSVISYELDVSSEHRCVRARCRCHHHHHHQQQHATTSLTEITTAWKNSAAPHPPSDSFPASASVRSRRRLRVDRYLRPTCSSTMLASASKGAPTTSSSRRWTSTSTEPSG
jgi:hypothetical protein